MSATAAADIVVIAFQSLTAGEQDEAFVRIKELRLQRLAGTDAEISRFIKGLALVQQRVEGEMSVDDYREWIPKLRADGQDIPPLSQVTKYFGSWSRAKEALLMADDETPLKIDARFRARRVGKVHRYRDSVLEETVKRCAEYVGHPPLVVEFEVWRRRELELAKAQGQDISVPSSSPYRTRFGSWEAALLHFGFSQEEIDGAHEASEAAAAERLRPFVIQPGSNESVPPRATS
jgi:hypothetical protein